MQHQTTVRHYTEYKEAQNRVDTNMPQYDERHLAVTFGGRAGVSVIFSVPTNELEPMVNWNEYIVNIPSCLHFAMGLYGCILYEI